MSMLIVDGHSIECSHEEKILFPDGSIAKGQLIAYYEKMGHLMLPFTQNRPLTMQRFPEGIQHEGFFQKDKSDYFPSWIDTKRIQKQTDGTTRYVVANNVATLVYLANQACITPHLWLSTIDSLKKPDRLIFDLDPAPKQSFDMIKDVAFLMQEFLQNLGLISFPLLTGSRGIHVIVPLVPQDTYTTTRAFARHVAELIVQKNPKLLTTQTRKEKRTNKLLIDYYRNGYGATAVAPYGVRARPYAPVAAPVTWQELAKIDRSDHFTIETIGKRPSHTVLWKNFFSLEQHL